MVDVMPEINDSVLIRTINIYILLYYIYVLDDKKLL